ncbi:MAG: sigma-70 family RNA polymerase sigma factor [Bacteroidota bacterium]
MSDQPKDVCEKSTFQRVFMTHSEELRNFLYYRCGQMQQAEDLVQECFVRLWKNCAKVTIEKAKGFLFTAGNNLFLNEIKHQKVVLQYHQQVRMPDRDKADPQKLLEYEEFRTHLKEAIEDLQEGQRTVFLMNRSDGKTYKEIAELLGLSVKAVEKRMHGALVHLRKSVKINRK